MVASHFFDGHFDEEFGGPSDRTDVITHWMELPNPPSAVPPSEDAPTTPQHECYCKFGAMPHNVCVCAECNKQSPVGTMQPALDPKTHAIEAPTKEPPNVST